MKRILRLLCLFCCLVLLPLPALQEAAAPSPAPNIRVRLRRLGLTDRIDLIPRGRYLVRGQGCEILLPENMPVTLQLRENRLVLYNGELSVSLGTSVSFLRQDTGSTLSAPALTIVGQNGVYPGDLTLTAADGQLNSILTLSLEDYLLGVLPYEMNEHFPLEALKAQAVCARTYALSRSNAKKSYDVVDTTDDQVFRGVDETNANAARAVAETAGLVITYNGKLAEGYYSASNGGQTELPSRVWNSSAAGCYAVTDDPYDLENPDSMVRSATLRKDASNLYKAFLTLLRNAVMAQPEMKGYADSEAAFRVDALQAMEVTAPRYDPPCRLMTRLRVTLSVSGRKILPSPTPAETGGQASSTKPESSSCFDAHSTTSADDLPDSEVLSPTSEPPPAPTPELGGFEPAGTYTVELSLFPDVLYALGISVSGANNEIVTVQETDSGFILEARRFGHGVGLSQRGAQWMAAEYGKNFEEIIAFYFPGMQLKRVTYGAPVLPTPDPVLAATPGPAATPTPRPTLMPVSEKDLPEGAWLASVEKIDDDSSLNLRAQPSAASEILMRLYKHQRLIVLEDDQVPGWARVKTDTVEGFVMLSFLERLSP